MLFYISFHEYIIISFNFTWIMMANYNKLFLVETIKITKQIRINQLELIQEEEEENYKNWSKIYKRFLTKGEWKKPHLMNMCGLNPIPIWNKSSNDISITFKTSGELNDLFLDPISCKYIWWSCITGYFNLFLQ